MMKRVLWIAVAAAVAIGVAIFVRGRLTPQQNAGARKKYSVIVFSYVTHPVLDTVRSTFENGLRERLAAQGIELSVRSFNAEGADSKLPSLSSTILREESDLIVPIATPTSAQLIKDAPPNVPIVYSFVTNPENLGEARRTKNVTGVSDSVNYRGNVELMMSWMPKLRQVGILFNPAEQNSEDALRQVRPIFQEKNVRVLSTEVAGGEDVGRAGRSLADKVDAFYVGGDNTVVGAVVDLVKIAAESRKPVFASDVGSVEKGALAALSVDYREIGRATADLAWRVLRDGKAPRELLPVTISGADVVFNRTSASERGLPLPAQYADRARNVAP